MLKPKKGFLHRGLRWVHHLTFATNTEDGFDSAKVGKSQSARFQTALFHFGSSYSPLEERRIKGEH
jgi:hypothetical protein